MSGAISATVAAVGFGASMATAIGVGALGAAAVGTAASVYGNKKQAKAQRAATRQAEQQAEETAMRSREALRKENQKQADTTSILEQNQNLSLSGASTLLTDVGGINQNDLTLGKSNKLG